MAGRPSGARSVSAYSNCGGGGESSAGLASHALVVDAKRVCSDLTFLPRRSRKNPAGPLAVAGLRLTSSLSLMVRVTLPFPPLQRNSGLFERLEQQHVLRAPGADRSDRVGSLRVEHGGEPGELLDDLLVDDVGLVETDLRLVRRRCCRS